MQVTELMSKGPSTGLGDAYRDIMTWMQENGYKGAAPSMEGYTSRPKYEAGETILPTRIRVPVPAQ